MNFKCAAQTIVFGRTISDWSAVFRDVKRVGFQGVEIFQPPRFICAEPITLLEASRSKGSPQKLMELLDEYSLKLLGLSGGSLRSKVEFAQDLTPKHTPLYLYIEDESELKEIQNLGPQFQLAIHPHLQKGIENFNEAFALINRHPEVKLLPDTAHLYLAGENILEILEKYASSIVAIHLKGWTHQYGWTRVNYAQGFVELPFHSGLPLEEVREWLHANWKGWVVIEQDYTHSNPSESLEASLRWLRNEPRSALRFRKPRPVPIHDEIIGAASLLEASSISLRRFYDVLAECARQTFRASTADVLTVDARQALATAVSTAPETTKNLEVEPTDESLNATGLDFACRERTPYCESLPSLSSSIERVFIPILNVFNPNAVDLIVRMVCPHSAAATQLAKYERFSHFVGQLHHHCWMLTVTHLEQAFSDDNLEVESIDQFLGRYVSFIRNQMGCRGVTILLADPDFEDLHVVASTGLHGNRPIEDYVIPISDANDYGRSMLTKTELNFTAEEIESGKMRHADLPWDNISPRRFSVLISPICGRGGIDKPLGVIRCTYKDNEADSIDLSNQFSSQRFTITDELILNAIQEGMSVRLKGMLEREKYIAGARCLRHEILNSLTFSKQALNRLSSSLKEPILPASDRFRKFAIEGWESQDARVAHSLNDIQNYFDLMMGVLGRSKMLEYIEFKEAKIRRVILEDDIVGPCLHQLTASIEDRRRVARVKHKRELSVDIVDKLGHNSPAIFTDSSILRMIVFNLLLNSIKYSDLTKGFLRIEVDYDPSNGPLLHFKDWGIGVSESAKSKIFAMGFRERKVLTNNDFGDGDGIGLWFSKRACRSLGAELLLTQLHDPTIFTIKLTAKHLMP